MTEAVQGPWGQRSTASAVAAAEMAARNHQPAAPPPAGGAPVQVGFSGRGGPLFGLLFKGFFLQLVTLGIYRFWLTTDLRRFYWSSTAVGGEAFTYTGTGMELLKGFLFALAILVPLQAFGFFLALGLPSAESVVTIGVTFILLFLGQYAVYASRRYRLARTSWRGLRLRMTGSAWAYAIKAFGLWLLVIVTLGIAYPHATTVVERIKMRETFYGDAPGDFVGRPGELMRRLWLLWLIAVVVPIGLAAAVYVSAPPEAWAYMLSRIEPEAPALPPHLAFLTVAVPGVLGAGALVILLLVPAFQAITFRWRTGGMRLGGAALSSDFRIGTAYRVYFVALLIFSVLGTAAGIAATLAAGGAYLAFGSSTTGLGVMLIVFVFIGYLALIGGFWMIKQIFLDLPLFRAKMNSVTVSNLASLDEVHARNVDASALGEGLGSAVDFGIGL